MAGAIQTMFNISGGKMELEGIFRPGMFNEAEYLVEERFTASHIGSGAVRVLATPMMIALMEITAHRQLAASLPEGYSSVGSVVNVRHLAPTPCGSKVRIRSEILNMEGNRVTFRVQAWDDVELVGDGEHERVVIQLDRFLRRVTTKVENVEQPCKDGS